MHRRQSLRGWRGGLLALLSCVAVPPRAHAQFAVDAGQPLDMSSTVVAKPTPEVVNVPPIASRSATTGPQRARYNLPFLSQARRDARTSNRYTVARPVYAGRPGVTFAPYSDYYFPRVIGSKETVYTASPEAPTPVGYRAFARPGTPAFPR